jgi:glycosyltransferase involved in cell wall biosynthesis
MKWEGSFAKARNMSIGYASCDWVMWMDADDRIADEHIAKINRLKNYSPEKAYAFLCRNIDRCTDIVKEDSFGQVRFFPNWRGIAFSGNLHESIKPDLDREKIEIGCTDIEVEHHGYQSREKVKNKIERNRWISLCDIMGLTKESQAEVLELNFGEYTAFYYPNVLTVWHGLVPLCAVDPFGKEECGSQEDRLKRIKQVVKLHVDNYEDSKKMMGEHLIDATKELSDMAQQLGIALA